MIEILKKTRQELFESFYFVSLATDKKPEINLSFQYIKVEKNKIVATNGHALHIVEMKTEDHGIGKGFWKVTKRTKTIIHIEKLNNKISFPDFNGIVDYFEQSDKTWKGLKPIDDFYLDSDLNNNYAKVIRNIDDEITLSFKLFENALSYAGKQYCYRTKTEPIVFRNKNFYSYIMPMKM